MTNLEYYINELLSYAGNSPYIDRAMQKAISKFVYKHRFEIKGEDPESFLNWLYQKHKEPIKLKQWEYDLILPYKDSNFIWCSVPFRMKEKGYFKGVTDTSMKIEDILKKCEIVSDDYEGFDECK